MGSRISPEPRCRSTTTLAKQVRLADQPLKNILRQTVGQDSHRTLFNNAAQAWNHAFYWRSLKPNGGGAPDGEIANLIDSDFGGYAGFAEQFRAAAVGQSAAAEPGWCSTAKPSRSPQRHRDPAAIPRPESRHDLRQCF